jgi:hypothetical protein
LYRTTTTGVDKVLDGRKREDYLNNIQSSFEIDDNESEEAVRNKTLKETRSSQIEHKFDEE